MVHSRNPAEDLVYILSWWIFHASLARAWQEEDVKMGHEFTCFLSTQMLSLAALTILFIRTVHVYSAPSRGPPSSHYFDVQGHRGSRGNTIENLLPSFAWGLIDGATTLELDNGITKDGIVVVQHDMFISPEKCQDTIPAFNGDPDFPYVGKYIVNLTLAQIKTLDCGSKRLVDFPMQLSYPGTKISTLQEVFQFADCADPKHQILWNIESKIDAINPNNTHGVGDFVMKQHVVFMASSYPSSSITYQSLDWRTLVGMKALDSQIATAALLSPATTPSSADVISPWLAGLRLSDFPGSTLGIQAVNAAKSIKADIMSPAAVATMVLDPTQSGFIPFTTKKMVDQAHQLGMTVNPWTVNHLNVADQLLDWGVDGIITDFPGQMRNRIEQKGLIAAPTFPKQHVLDCLAKHLKLQGIEKGIMYSVVVDEMETIMS